MEKCGCWVRGREPQRPMDQRQKSGGGELGGWAKLPLEGSVGISDEHQEKSKEMGQRRSMEKKRTRAKEKKIHGRDSRPLEWEMMRIERGDEGSEGDALSKVSRPKAKCQGQRALTPWEIVGKERTKEIRMKTKVGKRWNLKQQT